MPIPPCLTMQDFELGCVQLWGLAPPPDDEYDGGASEPQRRSTDAAGGGSGARGAAPVQDSVLQARRADALLLPFVGIERQVAGMRV